jgi:hypothetical protein
MRLLVLIIKPGGSRVGDPCFIEKNNYYNWPIRKSELVNKYLKQVIHYTDSIDYEKL